MSRGYESHISVWEDYSWRGTAHTNPLPLHVDSESFQIGKEIKNLANLTRDGRVSKVESQVGGPVKPFGNLTYQPRAEDAAALLFSHFQMGTISGTGPYTYTFVPSKGNPTYTNNSIRGTGAYGSTAKDVYSVSFLKKYFDTSQNGGTNSQFFEHGICDNLTFDIPNSDDFQLSADYKFRDVITGTAISGNPGDTGYGTYATGPAWQWFEGTVLVEGQTFDLETIKWTGKNNLVEKNIMGRRDPDWFAFGDYMTDGQFTMDFPKDGFLQIGSMLGTKSFSIVGTLFKSATEFLAFSLPHCIRKPFDVVIQNEIDVEIPFSAYEKDGTSPVTVTLVTNGTVLVPGDLFWDAGTSFTNSNRTLGDYALVDGGTSFTNANRTLIDYTLADRDL